MLLKDYIPNVKNKFKKTFFSGISFESSKVKKNNIFFAVKGNSFDGNDFIPAAIKKGSKVIISEKKIGRLKKKILYIQTQNIRKLLAEVSFKIYRKKPKNLIAITGTNGKSSIAEFYYQILKLNNKKVATKSGIMVGLGEERDEIIQVMDDLRSADVDFLTIGQYLQPSVKHHPLDRYYHPNEFKELEVIAKSKGFLLVSSSPLTRSSYHADEDFAKLKQNRFN
jgi:hypothetical protein